jgi:hypothetical protein
MFVTDNACSIAVVPTNRPGFWEWIGSAAVFLFLLSSALFLPEQTSGLRGRRQTEKTLDVDCRQIVDRKSAI